MEDLTRLVAAADDAGYALVPVEPGGKVSRTWWNERAFTLAEVAAHARSGGNVAARVGATRDGVRVVVVDRDARDRATWEVVRKHRLHRTPMQVETPSAGWHLWFRLADDVADLRTRIRLAVGGTKLPLDVKATGYVLLPGSRVGGAAYRFRPGTGLRPPADLPPLPAGFVDLVRESPEAARRPPDPLTPARMPGGVIRNPEAYVLRVESHQGVNGSAGLVRAVCVLRDAGRTPGQALAFLLGEWNRPPRVTPPWSAGEIEYAVRRHFR